ncbi:hypothetical protein U1Q18_008396 [Sarracenia purpurea var. burkii]
MASYTSDFTFPNFIEYYLTLNTDYDGPGTYGEPIQSSQEEFGSFFPSPISLPNVGEAYFDGFWEEDPFSYGLGFDPFNEANDSGTEKAEAQVAEPWEEQYGGYYSYGNGMEMQPANDYNTWSGDEDGNEEEEEVHDDGTDNAYNSSYNWDEMELCERIFGGWEILGTAMADF